MTSAPSGTPSTANRTPATPALSVAAALTMAVPDTVVPAAGAVIETDGGVTSGPGALVTVTCTPADVVAAPSLSYAFAVSV